MCLHRCFDCGLQLATVASCYRDTYDLKPGGYPVAERIWQGCLSLPIYPTLSDEELSYVCRTLRQCLAS